MVGPPGLLANDVDPEGESLRLLSAGPLANGRFTVLVTNGRFTYVRDAGFVGVETFSYTMEDESGNQAMGMVTIEVFGMRLCDVNDDSFVDREDVEAIFAAPQRASWTLPSSPCSETTASSPSRAAPP